MLQWFQARIWPEGLEYLKTRIHRAFQDSLSSMIGLLAGTYTPSDEKMTSDDPSTINKPSYSDKQVDISSPPPPASLTSKNTSAMMFEHIYGVALFIVMRVALLCVFKMYLALTATCR